MHLYFFFLSQDGNDDDLFEQNQCQSNTILVEENVSKRVRYTWPTITLPTTILPTIILPTGSFCRQVHFTNLSYQHNLIMS
jgi:hypothetical protein